MGQFGSIFASFVCCIRNLYRRGITVDELLIVEVEQGKLRGKECRSIVENVYYSFSGVPYAKPPVGELRFLPPVEPDPWQDLYDATYERNECLQKDLFLKIVIGSEDCLYLNVYTPKPPIQISTLLPVLVFIHGGGFYFGSGSRKLYSADYWMQCDVILVTFNYRLNIFGFLNLQIPECPGNVGLKDQVQVLKWVQKNIRQFGGDPSNVTIFGESAGAAAVQYLMISPLSQGLFHKAILQSGNALANWAYGNNPIEVAFSFAKRAGYRGSDRRELINYLRTLSAVKLVKIFFEELFNYQQNVPTAIILMKPSLELIKQNAFLPDPPEVLVKRANLVPCVYGINDQEGIVTLKVSVGNILNELEKNFDTVLKDNFLIDPNLVPEKAAEVRRLYFENKTISSRTLKEFSTLMTHVLFYNFHEAVETHLQSNSLLYMYRFRYSGGLNFGMMIARFTSLMVALRFNLKGACHGDELFYQFYPEIMPFYPKIEGDDLKMVENMTTMWTNFARTGNPSLGHVEWKPCTPDNYQFLDITAKPIMCNEELCGEKFQKFHQILDPVIKKKI